jgi:hypothetical protein
LLLDLSINGAEEEGALVIAAAGGLDVPPQTVLFN